MNKTRPKKFMVRVSEEEWETVNEKVKSSGMNQQQYLLAAILGQSVTNTDGVKELVPELKRIGNNLNQIARASNQGLSATSESLDRINEEMNEVWRLLKQYLRAKN